MPPQKSTHGPSGDIDLTVGQIRFE